MQRLLDRRIGGALDAPLAQICFYALVVVFSSKVAWYDLRTVEIRTGGEADQTINFVLWSIALLPIFALILIGNIARAPIYRFAVPFIVLIIYAVLTGAVAGNSSRYIAQEVFKYAFVPVAFSCAYRFRGCSSEIPILNFMAAAVVVMMILRLLLFIQASPSDRLIFIYGTITDTLPVAVIVALLVYQVGSRREIFARVMVLLLVMVLILLGQKRTLVACLGIIVLAVTPLLLARARFFTLVSAVTFGLLLTYFGSTYLEENEDLFRKLASTEIENLDEENSLLMRFFEADTILRNMEMNAPYSYVFGLGGGATFQVEEALERRTFVRHSAHITPMAMFYRHGLLGIAMWLYVIVYVVLMTWRLRNDRRADVAALRFVSGTYAVMSLFASLLVFGVVDDVILGLLAGRLARVARDPVQVQDSRIHAQTSQSAGAGA